MSTVAGIACHSEAQCSQRTSFPQRKAARRRRYQLTLLRESEREGPRQEAESDYELRTEDQSGDTLHHISKGTFII